MEVKGLLFFLVLMFVVCFIFPLTLNYVAQGYNLPSEVKFFTVMVLTFLIVGFTIWVWSKSRSSLALAKFKYLL
ncbi:MAG: hypothetical protein ACKD6O_08195 [Candidatus Bathyarchaeota archaeon]